MVEWFGWIEWLNGSNGLDRVNDFDWWNQFYWLKGFYGLNMRLVWIFYMSCVLAHFAPYTRFMYYWVLNIMLQEHLIPEMLGNCIL